MMTGEKQPGGALSIALLCCCAVVIQGNTNSIMQTTRQYNYFRLQTLPCYDEHFTGQEPELSYPTKKGFGLLSGVKSVLIG